MNINQRLLEPEIKAMILNHLKDRNKLNQGATIINEFTIDDYSRRVDLAVIDTKYFIAFEVKSEADSLNRLVGQTQKYLEYFDKVVIAAASKHIDKIIETVPQNVAVWEVCDGGLKIRRRGKIIPISNKSKFIGLMKANELLKLCNKLSLSPKSKNRHSVKMALQNVPLSTLREATLQYIQERFSMTNSLFWQNLGSKQALPEHVELLSPYKEERRYKIAQKAEKEAFWKEKASFLVEDQDLIAMSKRQNNKAFGSPPIHIQRLLIA